MANVPTITAEELKSKLDANEPLHLFETLAPEYFRHSHIPGAINVPPAEVAEKTLELVPDKDAEIVVYCVDSNCHAAENAARELMALGYTNVRDFVEGKKGWEAAGYELERHQRRAAEAK